MPDVEEEAHFLLAEDADEFGAAITRLWSQPE
jgi:hypothetical protein